MTIPHHEFFRVFAAAVFASFSSCCSECRFLAFGFSGTVGLRLSVPGLTMIRRRKDWGGDRFQVSLAKWEECGIRRSIPMFSYVCFFCFFKNKCFLEQVILFLTPRVFFSCFWALGWFLYGHCLGQVALMVALQPHLRQLKLGKVGWRWTKPVWWLTSSWSKDFRWECHLLPTRNQIAKFKARL